MLDPEVLQRYVKNRREAIEVNAKVGRADGPIYLWGPSGTEPRLGTRHRRRATPPRFGE